MKYLPISKKIISHCRGKLSQAHLSQKMGFKHNQIFKWEMGQRRIPWTQFALLCKIKKIPLSESLLYFGYTGNANSAKDILSHLIGKSETKVIAKALQCSSYRINGWLNGKREPYLDDMLKFFDLIEHRMEHFIVHLIKLEPAKSLGLDLSSFLFEKFEVEYPVFSAVLRIMETKEYIQMKTVPKGYFAKRLGLHDSYETSLFAKAMQLGLLAEKAGKYVSKLLHTDIRYANRISEQRLFWCRHAVKRLESRVFSTTDHAFGNLVYSASKKEQEKIWQRYLSFFNDVRGIINSGDEPEDVYVLNVQLMPVSRPKI